MATAPPTGGVGIGPPPPPPPFALGPGQAHNVLQIDDPVHDAAATKLYYKQSHQWMINSMGMRTI